MINEELREQLLGETHDRSFTIQVRADDDDGDVFEMAFSSEMPVERYFGEEVLVHDPRGVRLDRLNGGGAVLVNHNTDDQVGGIVAGSARIDNDRRGRCAIRFSKSARGQEIKQDVVDEIRKCVSCRYKIHKYEVTEREGQPDLVRITDWEVLEVSIVPIPADESAGFGRSAERHEPRESSSASTDSRSKPEIKTTERAAMTHETDNGEQKPQTTAPTFDVEAERSRVRTEEKKRADGIRAMAAQHDLEELGRQGIDEGWSVEDFNKRALEKIGERNNSARAKSEHNGEVDLSNKDRKEFSLLRLMDALANKNDRAAQDRAGFELEVSAEAVRGFGPDFNPRGSFIPETLLTGRRDLSAGTATDGAELVASNLLAGSYIEVLRNASRTMQAGVMHLPGLVGNVDIPRQTSAAAATWISSEGGDATESEPQFDQVSLSPKDLACYIETTRRLRQQSTPAIDGLIRNDLAKAAALGIDLAALYGSASSGQPRGISLTAGINTKDLSAADPTYAELVEMVALVMADNAIMGTPSWIIESNGWEALMTTPKQGSGVEGNFILNDANGAIVGHRHFVSNQVTAEQYFFGDFSQVLLGEWGGLELNVDPYTKALSGTVRFVMFKTADIAVRYPAAFCYAHDGIA